MKKIAILFSTLLLFLLLSVGSFLLFLPYIADTYLFPRIIKDLPFAEKEISLSRISPWKLRGTISLADSGHDILTLPGIEFNFSPQSILNNRVKSILIEGGTLHLNLDQADPAIYDQSLQVPIQKHFTLPLRLPFTWNSLAIKNSTIILHRGRKEHHFVINGSLTGDLLTSVTAKLHMAGAFTLSSTLNLTQKEKGHELLFTISSPDLSGITHLFPEVAKFNAKGQLALSGHLQTENLTRITELQATGELSNNPSSRPLIITVNGDKETVSAEIKDLFIAAPLQSFIDIQGKYSLAGKEFTGTGQAELQAIQPSIKFSFSGNHTLSEAELNFTASVDSFSIGEKPLVLFSPFFAHGDLNIRPGRSSGSIGGSIARVTLPSQKIEFNNISISLLPQFLLPDQKNAAGTFAIETISYNKTPAGSLEGQISLNSEGAEFSTHIASIFNPDLQIKCGGTLTMDRHGKVTCHLPKTYVDSTTFPPFFHRPSKFSLFGDLSAEAALSFSDRITGGNLHLQFNDGTMNISENRLSSIDMEITLPDLPLLQSKPSQLCTVGLIQLGNIKFSDAKIHFRVEDAQSIFIEKSSFAWCDGKVESGSLQLSTTAQEVATTLYCDRLKFTTLLSQFGIEDTEGEGTLNGRLPILISGNNIEFDDGFLFSTPGDGGIVRFNNTAQLRHGIGTIDQTPYLDYSMQALENFSYNWTKLTFNSQESDLLIKMQIDGKPAVALPFGYKKGHIVPTKKGQGLQHPIRLDINFLLPLTDLFQYGKNMQPLLENK